MRKIFILILILLVLLFASIIVVDERESAVITGINGSQRVVHAGIYFTWPVWDKVTYVFTNERTALLSLAVKEPTNQNNQLQVEVLINYKVIDPARYLSAIQKSAISEKIAVILLNDLKNKITTTTLDQLNQVDMIHIDPNKFIPLGIRVDQIHLLNIKFIPILPLSNNENKTKVSLASVMSIESVYYETSIIKSKTKLEVDTINHNMQIKDPEFYAYFKMLKTYEQKAKTRADVPPLTSLGK
ncbi:MAG: hypothetical protein K0R94_1680 [Burkholderiales bacterium]|jgi:hypothetical protein|nr:hypothetical protein [Burkholderiales bacterium]